MDLVADGDVVKVSQLLVSGGVVDDKLGFREIPQYAAGMDIRCIVDVLQLLL